MVLQRNTLFHAGPRIRVRSPRHTWWKEKVNLLFPYLDMRGSGNTEINFNFFPRPGFSVALEPDLELTL